METYTAAYWIDHLQLSSHPEGGYYAEYYRSPLELDAPPHVAQPGKRNICTGIYFLLQQGQFSAFHRIASDEIWHFYYGEPLHVLELDQTGKLTNHKLGNQPHLGQNLHCVIQAGNWFAAALGSGSGYSLCGCTVSPGFDFHDFELAKREDLMNQFPQHFGMIYYLTR